MADKVAGGALVASLAVAIFGIVIGSVVLVLAALAVSVLTAAVMSYERHDHNHEAAATERILAAVHNEIRKEHR